MKNIFKRGTKFLFSQQSTVFSAATLIMTMIIASRVLGLVRQRVLANYFVPDQLSLFFAAFRLPDLIFEVLVYGTFSSAFIPVFTKLIRKEGGTKEAWDTAGRVVNIGLLIFSVLALLIAVFADPMYRILAPGYSIEETIKIAQYARILFAAQALFVISYVLTGILESMQRFLVPALAPVFYNLGIIVGTIVLAPSMGLFAPAIGVVIGACAHLLVQLPMAIKLGFRFSRHVKPNDWTKKIGKLALPRFIDLSFEQFAKTAELYFASLISTASYTYFTFANSLAIFPVSLIGTSMAKAALPTLARLDDNLVEFRRTLFGSLSLISFMVLPFATLLIVLRIPVVRLVYGTDIFDWEATVQTGMVLSAFAFGILFQSIVGLMERAFYALHNTKTPVTISIVSLLVSVIGDALMIGVFHFPAWALAASFTFSVGIQALILFILLNKQLGTTGWFTSLWPISKSIICSVISGSVMYFFLKFFDKYAWVKHLTFIQKIDININFERFVLDTRYTFNLIILTAIVGFVGIAVYLLTALILKSNDLKTLFRYAKRMIIENKFFPAKATLLKETESVNLPDNS